MSDGRVTGRIWVGRMLALLAVGSAPALIWIGWWQIAISFSLALAAAVLSRRQARGRERPRLRRLAEAVQRRLNPHVWRPGSR